MLLALLSLAVAIAAIVIVRQSLRLAAYERQHAADARALDAMRRAIRQGQARAQMPPPQFSEARPAVASSRPEAAENPELSASAGAMQQLSRELQEAQASIARLQAQLQEAGQARQEAMAAAEDLQKRERELREQFDSTRQQLDAARAESQAARERAAGLEADNAKMKNESGARGAQATELRKALATLADLDRRRDSYLTSIIRRYREITDQFRTVAGTLDSSRGAESVSSSGAALSRIQNAISLAEDDMRRLNELNAQAHQLENKLAKN